MNKAAQKLLQQTYLMTVNELLVMSVTIGIITQQAAKSIQKELDLDTEASDEDAQFIMTYSAKKAQEIVFSYSEEEIKAHLEAIQKAKQIAIQSNQSIVVTIIPVKEEQW